MPKTQIRYASSDRLSDLIDSNNQLLLVVNRFHIPFGFGDSTVAEVCDANGIDCDTFLAVAEIVSGNGYSSRHIDPSTLVPYLREAHSYILDFRLPDIRQTLISAVYQPKLDGVAGMIIRFFDEYVDEVRAHMDHEDSIVFPYVDRLLAGQSDSDYKIADFASHHEAVVTKLDELKDIFIRHYAMPNTRLLNRALFNIDDCGRDLISHCEIENVLLVPAVEALERTVASSTSARRTAAVVATPLPDSTLSAREREIIGLVAHGLVNKEIADRLSLSFHTITTYRKNISAKLNIHSTAALTIYAVLHGLVDPKEIELK